MYGQDTRLTIKKNNVELEHLLTEIEAQSEFFFFYSNEKIDKTLKVTVDAEDKSIAGILEEALQGTDISYRVINKAIILARNDVMQAAIRQGISISGTVTDAEGEPMPGVNVVIQGTTIGVVTDRNGQYEITVVDKETVLVFSFVGYVKTEIPVGDQIIINVALSEETRMIDEVVVIGYGTRQRKSVTGAVEQIGASMIEDRPVGNTMQALQGAAANLTIQQRSMNPNDNSMNINIRGITTMNNNDPLIVIDGMISEVGSLNNLNPNDIENVSVLKDAGSAAIYGSRSANGVILVTTKKGSKENKPILKVNAMLGYEHPKMLFRPVKGYENALLRNQALINSGSAPVFTPEQIRDLQEHGDGEWFIDGILQNGLQQNYNASLSGGNQHSTYMVSAGYFNQESNFVGGYGLERYNFRTNLVNEYGRFKLSSLMAYNRVMQNAPNSSVGNLVVDGSRIPNYYYYKMKTDDGRYLLNDVLSEFNPLGILESGGYQKKDEDNFIGSISGDFNIMKGLTLKGMIGLDLTSHHRFIRGTEVPFYASEAATQPAYANRDRNTEDYNEKRYTLSTQLFLDFDRTFKEVHNVTGLIGVSNESYTRQANEVKKKFTDRDLGMPETETVVGTDSYNTPAATTKRSIYSVFGRAGYAFRDKYYADFSFRYDGTSKFTDDYRWGFFPSFSAGWRLSEESFMETYNDRVGTLKLRASYGVLGNQNVGDYSFYTTYQVYADIYGFNNETVAGTGFNFGNRELRWESTANANIGMDATFFRNKFFVSLDYFNKLTSDILLTPTVPSTLGGAVPQENSGKLRTQGWEASLGYRTSTGDFKHSISFNIADNWNKVVDFIVPERIDDGEQMSKIIRIGEPLGSYYGYRVAGYFGSYEDIDESVLPIGATVAPGDVKFANLNNDDVIDDKDREILGYAFPRLTFGFTYNVEWKGVDLGIFLQGVGKRDMIVRGELIEPFHANYSYVMYQHQLDFWTPVNTDAKYPRLVAPGSASSSNNYSRGSDMYMLNAAYLRLKNLSLGYTLPKKMTARIGIQKCRFSLNAQNLFTFAGVSFIDPESTEFGSNMGGAGGQGSNSGRNYPTLIYYGLGLDLEF
ncbi:MAG: TonB-dependent receptor [Bacteroidales bacterium]|nr:TonB-dependent receptor [Bacteroidales bacterium]